MAGRKRDTMTTLTLLKPCPVCRTGTAGGWLVASRQADGSVVWRHERDYRAEAGDCRYEERKERP